MEPRDLIEFIAVGTAVISDRYDLGDEPVLSNLSGQDFAKLYAAGYWPVGHRRRHDGPLRHDRLEPEDGRLVASLRTRSSADFTQGVQHARKLAVEPCGARRRELEAARDRRASASRSSAREHEHEGASGNKSRT